MRHRHAEIALLIAVLVASPAAAQNPAAIKAAKEQERTLYERGTIEYRLGYFEKAAALYEAAYRAVPDSALLYNIGQAYRKAGDRQKALVGYRSFVHTAPPGTSNVDLARKWIADLESAGNSSNVSTDEDSAMAPEVESDALTRAPAPSATPAAFDLSTSLPPSESSSGHRWWLWSAVGALIVGGIVTTLLVVNRAHGPMNGSVGTAVVP